MQTYYYLFTSFVPEVVTVLRGRLIENGLSSPESTSASASGKQRLRTYRKDFSEYEIQKKIYAFVFNVCVDDLYIHKYILYGKIQSNAETLDLEKSAVQ